MNDSGTGALFREKSAWATAGVIILVNGGALGMILMMPNNPVLWIIALAGAVVVQVIALTALHIVIALGTPQQPDDERDVAIEQRSTRYSMWIDTVAIWGAIFGLIAQRIAMGDDGPINLLLDPLTIAYGLFFLFVVSEGTRLVTKAMDYRIPA